MAKESRVMGLSSYRDISGTESGKERSILDILLAAWKRKQCSALYKIYVMFDVSHELTSSLGSARTFGNPSGSITVQKKHSE